MATAILTNVKINFQDVGVLGSAVLYEKPPIDELAITADHIARGERKSKSNCAIALALKEKGFVSASVGGNCIQVVDGKGRQFVFETPSYARDFIKRFDAGETCEPFVLAIAV